MLTWHTVFRRDDKTLSNFFIIATTEIINVIIIITMTMIQHQHPLFCLGITTFHHLQPRLLTICLHTHCYKGNLGSTWGVFGRYLWTTLLPNVVTIIIRPSQSGYIANLGIASWKISPQQINTTPGSRQGPGPVKTFFSKSSTPCKKQKLFHSFFLFGPDVSLIYWTHWFDHVEMIRKTKSKLVF